MILVNGSVTGNRFTTTGLAAAIKASKRSEKRKDVTVMTKCKLKSSSSSLRNFNGEGELFYTIR